MGTCLVTTLKEAVSDNTLLKIDELLIHERALNGGTGPRYFAFTPVTNDDEITATIVSKDGYFTDSTGTSNLGKTVTLTKANTLTYISNDAMDIVINNKNYLDSLQEWKKYSSTVNILGQEMELDISDLLGCSSLRDFRTGSNYTYGDISVFANRPLVSVIMENGEGDIANVAHATLFAAAHDSDKVYGNITVFATNTTITNIDVRNCPNVTGNLSSISGLTQLQGLDVSNSGVTGSLVSASSMTALKSLKVDNTTITGDTSDLASLANLTTFTYTHTAITGTWPLT